MHAPALRSSLPSASRQAGAASTSGCASRLVAQFRNTRQVVQPRGPSMAAASAASSSGLRTELAPEVREQLRKAEAFAFDVDSTFCEDESIDEIAAFLGVGEQVAALTAKAMGGTVEFKDALTQRLSVINPSTANMADFLARHPHRVTKGIPQLVKLLRSRGQEVFLVSGGFRQVIHPLAQSLDIPLTHVFANNILFDAEGAYAGFDEKEFTCRSGGKPAAIRHIKEKWGLKSVVMVGDGATDMEARLEGAASLFVGYGGVVERKAIAAKADWYIYDIQQLIDALS